MSSFPEMHPTELLRKPFKIAHRSKTAHRSYNMAFGVDTKPSEPGGKSCIPGAAKVFIEGMVV